MFIIEEVVFESLYAQIAFFLKSYLNKWIDADKLVTNSAVPVLEIEIDVTRLAVQDAWADRLGGQPR